MRYFINNKFLVLAILALMQCAMVVRAQLPADAALFFEEENYSQAMEAYQSLTIKRPKEALYQYRYGYSAYMLGEENIAVEYLTKSSSKYPQANYFLGEIYFINYNFDEAVEAYTKFLSTIQPEDNQLVGEVKTKITRSELGSRLIRRVEEVQFIDSVVVDKEHYLKKIKPDAELGYFTLKHYFEGSQSLEALEYTSQREDRKYYAKYIDGKFNLFRSNRLLDSWSEEESLEDINSEYNENYPFLMPDGVTLYFASDGEGSLGGYDIFISRYNNSTGSYLKPENIGMPFNSPYNDYLLIVDEVNEVGWFVSDRYLPKDKVSIYQFVPKVEKRYYQSEDLQFLASKAQLRDVEMDKGAFRYFENKDKEQQQTEQIYIDEGVIYPNEHSFKSNQARNLFYQSVRLDSELKSIQQRLFVLRKEIHLNRNKKDIKELEKEALELEMQLLKIKPEIDTLKKKMRIEEIKVIR